MANSSYIDFNNAIINNSNLYLLNEDYHGLYEDDYCTFTYLNVETGEIVREEWTTACACPAFELYKKPTLLEGIKNGNVDIDKAAEFLIKNYVHTIKIDVMDSKAVNSEKFIFGIPVHVNKGRKFKGNGTLVNIYHKTFTDRYGRKYCSMNARIITEDGSIAYAVADNCEFDENLQDLVDAAIKNIDIVKELKKLYDNVIIIRMFFKYNANHRSNGLHDPWSFNHTMLWKAIYDIEVNKVFPLCDEETADCIHDILETAKANKLAKQKASLMEWCKTTFAEEGEEKINAMYNKIALRKGYIQ